LAGERKPPEPHPRPVADEDALDNLEFLRAMRELEVRQVRQKTPATAAKAHGKDQPSVARERLQEEDDVFAAHMERLFSGAPDEPADRAAAEQAATAAAEAEAEAMAAAARAAELAQKAADREPDPEAASDAAALLHGSVRSLERRLKKGEIQPTAEVDLHRLRKDEAINRLDSFLRQSAKAGHEVLLVITGRGLHSVDLGVLRELVPVLLRRRWPDLVRECLPAPRPLGGEGAFVVLLRKVK